MFTTVEETTIRWIALSSVRTTGPWRIDFSLFLEKQKTTLLWLIYSIRTACHATDNKVPKTFEGVEKRPSCRCELCPTKLECETGFNGQVEYWRKFWSELNWKQANECVYCDLIIIISTFASNCLFHCMLGGAIEIHVQLRLKRIAEQTIVDDLSRQNDLQSKVKAMIGKYTEWQANLLPQNITWLPKMVAKLLYTNHKVRAIVKEIRQH